MTDQGRPPDNHLYKIFRQGRENEMAAVLAAMLTRDPAALYRENRKTERDSFRGGRQRGTSEKLLPRLFVTKKGLKTVSVKLEGSRMIQ